MTASAHTTEFGTWWDHGVARRPQPRNSVHPTPAARILRSSGRRTHHRQAEPAQPTGPEQCDTR